MGFVSGNFCLPVEAFEGGSGDLVLLQEIPNIEGDTYVRIFIKMDDAEELCNEIMRVAARARNRTR